MTAKDIVELGIADKILPEPLGGAHNEWATVADTIKTNVLTELDELNALTSSEITEQRYDKFRSFGKFKENNPLMINKSLFLTNLTSKNTQQQKPSNGEKSISKQCHSKCLFK